MPPPPERHHPRITITTELPMDIILYHILPRLPAKYLLLCRCVSKQWHSFLNTPLFNQMHLHHLATDNHQNHHKLLVFSTQPPWMFSTIDCESPEDGLTPARPLPFELAGGGKVLTSFDGIVCVGMFKNKYLDREFSDMILWNPLTGDYKRLTKAESHKECYKRGNVYGLYYTSCDDDYKLLCITRRHKAYIYSLKCDAWRKIDSGEHLKRFSPAYYLSRCTLVDEKIYFLNCSGYNYREPFDWVTHSILSFDTKTEKFSVIAASIPGNEYVRCLNHRGCLYLYVVTPESFVELWSLMNGDRDWSKVVTYPLNYMFTCNLMHLMKDGNWLTQDDGSVFRVDLVRRIKEKLWSYDRHSMRIQSRDRYIETLVSPNRYLK